MGWKNIHFAIIALGALLIGHTNVASAQCTIPNTLTNGQLADATKVMGNFTALSGCIPVPAGSTNALQFNAGSGALGSVGPLTNGQLAIGSNGSAPQAATLTPGTGISIINGPGTITITATGGGGGGTSLFDLSAGVPPWSSFTPMNLGADVISEAAGKAINFKTVSSDVYIHGGYKAAPVAPYRIAALMQRMGFGSSLSFMLGWRDAVTGRLTAINWAVGGTLYVQGFNNSQSWNNSFVMFGNMTPSQMVWFGLRDDGTNVYYELSADGVNFVTAYQEVKSSGFLSNYNQVYFGYAPSSSAQQSITLRLWDENGLTRSFP